ncbi:MAG: nitrous oxide reductase family maturation protein NosD, partial [Candidatus Thermoplasmatota archaeon]
MNTPVLLAFVVLAASMPLAAGAQSASTLVVSHDGAFATISDALSVAHDGDSIEVHSGIYPGGLVVGKGVHLVGIGRPILDGGGVGTVVRLDAANASLSGFVVRGSGTMLDHDDAGVTV